MNRNFVLFFVIVFITSLAASSIEAGPIAKRDSLRTPAEAARDIRSGKVAWKPVADSIQLALSSHGENISAATLENAELTADYVSRCTLEEVSGEFRYTYLDAQKSVAVDETIREPRVGFVNTDGIPVLHPACLNGMIAVNPPPRIATQARHSRPHVEHREEASTSPTVQYVTAPPQVQYVYVQAPPQSLPQQYGGYQRGPQFGEIVGAALVAYMGRPVVKNNGNTYAPIYAPDASIRGSYNGAGYNSPAGAFNTNAPVSAPTLVTNNGNDTSNRSVYAPSTSLWDSHNVNTSTSLWDSHNNATISPPPTGGPVNPYPAQPPPAAGPVSPYPAQSSQLWGGGGRAPGSGGGLW